MSAAVAANDADCDTWVRGLTYLMEDSARSSYSLMVFRLFILHYATFIDDIPGRCYSCIFIHCVSKKTGPLLPFAITPTVLVQ